MKYGEPPMLPLSLMLYDRYINDLVQKWGVYTRKDEFIREGMRTAYRVHKEKENVCNQDTMHMEVCGEIHKSLLNFFPSD
ncbi:hypothetical protein DXT76_07010 [Halobacillus trueperi]|uniref:Uncharacterized protein n=1 Tax=Halobacillus trueperi TaxID=156205 RepID=A0A3D8VSH4_9BACI|nr:hypothetical protein [Halobacillus trueperi]RDY71738.1 hypothetical protein DXT76_07010 [Halobacillus trueperi]